MAFKMREWSAFTKPKGYNYSAEWKSRYKKGLFGSGKSTEEIDKEEAKKSGYEGITSRRLPWRPEADRLKYPKRK